MVIKVNNFQAVSDAGFALISGGRDFWIYSEGKREIYVSAEGGHVGDKYIEDIHLGNLPDAWRPPNNIYAITVAKKREIAGNICQCLQALGIEYRII